MKTRLAAAAIAATALVALTSTPSFAQCGKASWYGPGFHGKKTASGERFNQGAMTAAHRSLPMGSKVVVTNKNNGKTVVVRINDRGPFIKGRVLDVSKAAAARLGFLGAGHTNVCMGGGAGKAKVIEAKAEAPAAKRTAKGIKAKAATVARSQPVPEERRSRAVAKVSKREAARVAAASSPRKAKAGSAPMAVGKPAARMQAAPMQMAPNARISGAQANETSKGR